jgi:hypothetical protein
MKSEVNVTLTASEARMLVELLDALSAGDCAFLDLKRVPLMTPAAANRLAAGIEEAMGLYDEPTQAEIDEDRAQAANYTIQDYVAELSEELDGAAPVTGGERS